MLLQPPHTHSQLPNNIVFVVNINEMWGNRMTRITMVCALSITHDDAAKGGKKISVELFSEDKWEALAMIQQEFLRTRRLRLSSLWICNATSHKYQLSTQRICYLVKRLCNKCGAHLYAIRLKIICNFKFVNAQKQLEVIAAYNMLSAHNTSVMINQFLFDYMAHKQSTLWKQFST